MFRKTILSLPAYAQKVNEELQRAYARLFRATTSEEKTDLQNSIDYWADILKRDRLGAFLPASEEKQADYAVRVENELKQAEEQLTKAKENPVTRENDKFSIARSNKDYWQTCVNYWIEEKNSFQPAPIP